MSTGIWDIVQGRWLSLLLIFVPISVIMHFTHQPKLWIFLMSALAIVPLAGLIGESTEQLANRVGPGIGGFLNATFGNATELIIALFALSRGYQSVVKASISGSIIGNILLVLGLSMFVGGWNREKQTFNRTSAGASSAMLILAVVALVMPAVFDLAETGSLTVQTPSLQMISLLVAVVLILTYVGSLVFSLKTHKDLLNCTPVEPHHSVLSVHKSVLLLLLATAVTAVEAELLVGSIETGAKALHMSEFFVGVVVVAVIGNAAEHFSAVTMAVKNKMDLSVAIATSSSTQIALFVAPVLVFASFLIGRPMSLVFNAFEIVGVALSVFLLSIVSLDGESNWFEGLQLVAVYLILGIVFFFVRH